MLVDGQAQIRDLVVGPGTQYRLLADFNPFQVQVRADQSGARPWGHGGWSGAEWSEVRVVPLRMLPAGTDAGSWLALQQRLAAAFRPVGDDTDDVECRFALGGREYVMFGRPRMVEAESRLIGTGEAFVRAAFVALDPRIYDAARFSETIGLPTFTGGLTVPFTVPFTIDATPVDGQVDVTNEGTTETGLTLRIDGPVSEPRVTVQGPDRSETLRYLGDIPSNRFLLIDTAKRTALVDGLPQANRRGQISGEWPLLPGNPDGSGATSTVLFRASNNEAAGTLTCSARSAWW